ncbi:MULTISPECIES: GGDEF domain-containing protein [Pseudoalteromonas]|uniref:GGDEF domain-containing protein n=1 Tax=Pseudoalteromonas TaxID=53246 RepID=UPI0002DB30E2|nr:MULTISPECIES: GGDEF domain-containing protein [Pseudoalteromonas]
MLKNYSDQDERKLVIKYFACIGFSATALMGSLAIFNQQYILFFSLFTCSSLFLYSWFIHKKEKVAASIISYTLYTLMLYLVLTGGAKGTGPIWIFIVPPVTFFIRGLKLGAIDSSVFILCIIAAFISADYFEIYEYNSPELVFRIILCFFIVVLLSGFYEFFRESHSKKIIALAKENETLATKDPLTGLPNRRYTIDYINELNKPKHAPLSIVLFDIDDFKKINDTYGHSVGDQALVHLASIFTDICCSKDIIARWGGEEFLLVLENTTENAAIKIADTLRLKIQNTAMNIENQSVHFTISGGVKEISPADSIDSAINSADNNLYRAKNNGKNQICC